MATILQAVAGTGTLDGASAFSPAAALNYKGVSKVILGQETTLDGLILRINQVASTAGGQLRGVIYADSSGAPGALVAATPDTTISSVGPAFLVFSSPVTLAVGTYWFGFHCGTGSYFYPGFTSSSTGAFRAITTDTFSDGTAASFGTPSTSNANILDVIGATKQDVVVAFGALGTGSDASSTSSATIGADVLRVAPYLLGGTAVVTHVAITVTKKPTAGAKIKGAIYSDQTSASTHYPNALLAQTAEIQDPSPGVHLLALTAPVTLSAGEYWLAQHVGGQSVATLVYASGHTAPPNSSGDLYRTDNYADGPATPEPTTGWSNSTSDARAAAIAGVGVIGIVPSSGPTTGGTNVTITGSGFTGATSVTFGGVAGTGLTVVDDGTITVTTGAHPAPGTVDVVVTAPAGPGTLVGGFTYVEASMTPLVLWIC